MFLCQNAYYPFFKNVVWWLTIGFSDVSVCVQGVEGREMDVIDDCKKRSFWRVRMQKPDENGSKRNQKKKISDSEDR